MSKALALYVSPLQHRVPGLIILKRTCSSAASGSVKKSQYLISTLGIAAAGGLGLWYSLDKAVNAHVPHAHVVHPAKLPWPHNGLISTLDHSALRRGYFVYKQVCSACHSLNYVRYRRLVDVCLTKDEAKAEAAEILVEDGPDDTGNMFMRPGMLNDQLPNPYKNKQAAAAANNGAEPPDLSLIIWARPGREDYIYSLLNGYMDAPEGVELSPGQAFNPYFEGGVISMPQQLFDDMLTYEDGTPATQSQMARDVTTFLKWVSEQEHDTRKLYVLKIGFVIPFFVFALLYWKRHAWTYWESRKFILKTMKGRGPPTK